MSHFIDIPANRRLLQQALNADLRIEPPLVIDSTLGPRTEAAIVAYRKKHDVRLPGPNPYAGVVDAGLLDALNLRQETNPMDTSNNWLSALVASTFFKYLIAMLATFIAGKLGVDHGSVEGILTQLVGVAMGAWGMYESSKSKVVVNGAKVNVKDLTPSDKATVAAIVANNK